MTELPTPTKLTHIVIRQLLQDAKKMTAEELYFSLLDSNIGISIGAVYANLRKLSIMGIVEVDDQNRAAKYYLNG